MSELISTIHLQRLKQLEDSFGHGEVEVTIPELAEVLFCSTRNVSKIMSKLQTLDWIHWSAGRGRGNKSHFAILSSFEELLLSKIQSKIRTGSLNDAYQIAEVFHCQEWFTQNLPKWLETFSENRDNSDDVIFLIPYPLERCHPLDLFDIHSGLYARVLFDTLVKFDPASRTFQPHLAHQFQTTEFGIAFRIRPNVHFHNGVLLTPQLVCEHLNRLRNHSPLYQQLLSAVDSFEVNKQWVEMRLNRDDPMLLHLFADIHFAIFLDNDAESGFPIGTGSYSWEQRSESCWTLVKNERYFGLHGIVRRADFWRVDAKQIHSEQYIIEYESINTSEALGSNDIQINGCNAVCFHQRLSQDIRELLVLIFKAKLRDNGNKPRNFCSTLIGYDNASEFDESESSEPSLEQLKTLEFSTLRYCVDDEAMIQPVLSYLRNAGVRLEPVSTFNQADFWIGDYSFGKDVLLGQYYWLLFSDYAQLILPVMMIQQWLDKLAMNPCLSQLFDHLERSCIADCRILPLWRKATRYKCHPSIKGNHPHSYGLMNLADIWLDKR
ncbi:SgrR family transcriptional regulator [Vibrio panuliri]|uniref:ABC transporter substrate-binding protein n=1 Tax=Vibrio panuliri TaxID=1381081 RepID=A0ABX3F8Z3_9VIBR|nr:SgrR family transcriptional regulator [Vibrio panuliri]KAB1458303.1 hypothetical protein F7O85_11415 [Vibrio panuliri]OLQ86785.1 hypothetical protein BIY20_02530 [Vibrio panuliri]